MFGFFRHPAPELKKVAILKSGTPLYVIDRCRIAGRRCHIDGMEYSPKMGAWAFYVPPLQLKVFHASDGLVHCTHESAPDRDKVFRGEDYAVKAPYEPQDWRNVFSKPVLRRVAENHVMYKRLHADGIGPELLGCCIVQSFQAEYNSETTFSAGVFVADLTKYRRKRATTEAQMLSAGVTPDRIRSAIRQQIRGYISDLNSVCGAMPVAAEGEVASIEQELTEYIGFQ